MSFKILVSAVESPLGKALEHELEREPFKLLLPTASELNWADATAVDTYIRVHQPDVVVNCYGWGELHLAEHPAQTARVDCDVLVAVATQLATSCRELNIPLIHFSSYRVFGADHKSTHSEKDSVAPMSDVGRALLAAEQVIIEQVPKHIILRLSWVIGAYGSNLLTRLLEAFFAGAAVTANRRLRGAPTTFSDASRVAVAIIKQLSCGAENWGVMHYCTTDVCTEEEFAEQLLQLLIQQQLLTAEPSLSLVENEPDDEPISAIIVCRRLRDGFGVQPRSWRPSLLPLVKQWLHQRQG